VVVGLGGLLAEGDDGVEREAVSAEPAHGQLEGDGDLPLGDAGPQVPEELVERLAAEPGRLPHGGHLALVLDLAELFDQRRRRDHRGARHGDPQPLAVVPAEPRRLEAEPVAGGAQHAGDGADLVAWGHDQLRPGDLGGRLLLVAAVGEEQRAVVQQQQRPVAAGEAGQVADVDPLGDQQGGKVGVGQQGAQGLAPCLGVDVSDRHARSSPT
jgi:hypothetical protein